MKIGDQKHFYIVVTEDGWGLQLVNTDKGETTICSGAPQYFYRRKVAQRCKDLWKGSKIVKVAIFPIVRRRK